MVPIEAIMQGFVSRNINRLSDPIDKAIYPNAWALRTNESPLLDDLALNYCTQKLNGGVGIHWIDLENATGQSVS